MKIIKANEINLVSAGSYQVGMVVLSQFVGGAVGVVGGAILGPSFDQLKCYNSIASIHLPGWFVGGFAGALSSAIYGIVNISSGGRSNFRTALNIGMLGGMTGLVFAEANNIFNND